MFLQVKYVSYCLNEHFVSVLFICLSMAKIKRKPLISVNDDRPGQVQQNHVEIHTISNGIINMNFDDIDDIDMIDNSSIETFNEDHHDMLEIPVDLVIENRRIGKSISYRDDIAQPASKEKLEDETKIEPQGRESNKINGIEIEESTPEDSLTYREKNQKPNNTSQEYEDKTSSVKQEYVLDHVHGPSVFQCSKNCFQHK